MTSRTIGRMLAAVSAAGLALAVAACGSGGGGGSTTADGRTALVWDMWSGSTAEVDAWEHLAGMVSAAHPDITVDFRTSSFDDYWAELPTRAGDGDAGCIVGVQSSRAPGVSDLLVPLDDLLAEAGVDAADFEPSIWQALRVDDRQLAVPYDLGPQVVFYNADRFRAAGVPVPTVGWTVQDFLAAAQALTGGEKYGFAVYPTIDSVVPWSLSLHGAQPVTREGTLDLTQPGFAAAVQWYADLVTQLKVAPQVAATNDPTPALSSFVAGDAAMVVDGPWQLVNVMGEAAFEVGVAPIPAGGSGSRTPVSGSGFGITRACPEPEAAMRAIAVLTGPEALRQLAERGRAFPARTAQQQAWFSPQLAGAEEGLRAAIGNGVPGPASEDYAQVAQLFTQHGVQAVNGQQSVPDFLDTVQREAG